MSTSPRYLGKYALQERLGYGGMAEVWKAFDTQLQRYVAIKLLHSNLREDPNFITRFQQEAQLIASLHHPNIVQIHDFQAANPQESSGNASLAYMVMDYVEGPSLADYIRDTSSKGHIPSPTEIVGIFTSISLAIDYAHQRGMIHRDIKPANILLDTRNTRRNPMGEPVLTDFGIAKLMGTSSNTQSGTQFGTPFYISPEQARGYPGNERSDLYSLGIILYEMVTGATPFRGETPITVITQQINATPPSPELINPNIPPPLAQIIMRSLAKDPSARFPTASSMTIALAEALHVPVPESLKQSTSVVDATDMPTYLSPPSSSWQPNTASPAPALPHAVGAPAPFTPFLGVSEGPPSIGAGPTNTPHLTPAQAYSPAAPVQVPPATPAVSPSSPPSMKDRRRRRLYIALASLLLIVLIGAGLGTYFLLSHTILAPPVSTVVGHAFFVSSGQLNTGTTQGIADQMQIDLQNIADPQPGKSYYAWLLGDKNPVVSEDFLGPPPIHVPLLLINNLPVHNGVVHFTYHGDSQHNNLFSAVSRLLITEENANRTPTAPSTDASTWRYYAELPQTPIPLDSNHFNALIHIRHLFYNEEGVKVLGLPGGLDTWLFRNTENLLEWSVSARDDWHGQNTTPTEISLIQAQFIRILDYLDGSPNVHLDVPANTPLLVDPTIAKVALLTVDSTHQGVPPYLATNPPGYVDHIQLHVNQVSKATDLTPEMRQLSARIIDAINNAKISLLNTRKDAVKLFNMTSDQLMQPAAGALLDDLLTQVTDAYIGQLDPATNQVHPGVLQAHYDIQQLATFTVTTQVPNRL